MPLQRLLPGGQLDLTPLNKSSQPCWPRRQICRRLQAATSTAEQQAASTLHTPASLEACPVVSTQQWQQQLSLRQSNAVSLTTPCLTPPPRLRVAVDVDEVLGRFLHSLNRFCLDQYGMEYDVGDYEEYNFAKVWGCSQEESNHIVHEFFKSHHFAVGVLPIPGAMHSLKRLGSMFDLVVVTSRQHVIRDSTLRWIDLHFPGIFKEVHFGNHWAMEGTSKPKSEICREVGAQVLIDDNPRYAVECADAGLLVLLYDWQHSYPWSKTADGPSHPLIQRVSDWIDVESALAAVVAAQQQAPL